MSSDSTLGHAKPDGVASPEVYRISKTFGHSEVLVEVWMFPDKYVTVSVKFSSKAMDVACEVQVTSADEVGTRFKSYPKVKFHSDGRVTGYGFLEDGVRFRTYKRDRDRHHQPIISVT